MPVPEGVAPVDTPCLSAILNFPEGSPNLSAVSVVTLSHAVHHSPRPCLGLVGLLGVLAFLLNVQRSDVVV